MSLATVRIGCDRAPLTAARTGIPVYARTLLAAIGAQRPDWVLHGFGLSGWRELDTAALAGLPEDAEGIGHSVKARLTTAALATFAIPELRRGMRRLGFGAFTKPPLDLFYALNFVPPGPLDCPVVPVVHDLFHLDHPAEVHASRHRALARLGEVLARAPRVHTVSRFTALRVSAEFGIPIERIDVVPPSVRPVFFAPAPVMERNFAAKGYWLAVGMGEPRKNLAFLLRLFQRHPRLCTPDHPLIVTGMAPWRAQPGDATMRAMQREGRLRFAGFVGDARLAAHYRGATALLVPSLHEGFGIPVIEALAAGAPVIAADTTALPEASGGHATHLPLSDPAAWAEALTIAREDEIDASRIADGQAYAARFTARNAAERAIASLDGILGK